MILRVDYLHIFLDDGFFPIDVLDWLQWLGCSLQELFGVSNTDPMILRGSTNPSYPWLVLDLECGIAGRDSWNLMGTWKPGGCSSSQVHSIRGMYQRLVIFLVNV